MTFVVKAARHVPIAAVAHFEGIIQIWELETGERLSTFRSVYDGQTRLAISRIGESVVAANWRSGPTGGVACYDTRTGDKLWHRTGLGQVHTMRFSEQGPWVWCDIESQPVHCLDANTGETLATWPAVQRIFDGPFSPRHLLLVSHASFVIGTMEKHITIPRANSSFRDVAFTPDAAILCERDVVRSIHIETGKELWTYAPSEGDSMTRLSFQSDDCVYGIKSPKSR